MINHQLFMNSTLSKGIMDKTRLPNRILKYRNNDNKKRVYKED